MRLHYYLARGLITLRNYVTLYTIHTKKLNIKVVW